MEINYVKEVGGYILGIESSMWKVFVKEIYGLF